MLCASEQSSHVRTNVLTLERPVVPIRNNEIINKAISFWWTLSEYTRIKWYVTPAE